MNNKKGKFMKKILLSSTLLLFALTFNACVEKSIVTNTNQPTILRTNPSTTPTPVPSRTTVVTPSVTGESHQLKTVQGSILTIQERKNGFIFPQFKNKVVLLQIFGQDCPYCFKEMPIINRVKRRYAGNLQIIALQAQEAMSQQTSSRLIQQFQMDYPIIDKDEARSLLYTIQSTYGWTGILPYILVIKNGVTEYSFSGQVSHQELDEAVRSLL
jgi:thiol-disulfide isomerase/thioredoxin